MIATNLEPKVTVEPLTKEVFLDLILTRGACVTFVLPPYRPGEPEQPAALLKAELQEAARVLAKRAIPQSEINELLEPVHKFVKAEELQSGSGLARILFRSHDTFRRFVLAVNPAPKTCNTGNCFYIRPVLASLASPANVYLLEVTKKSVELLACGPADVTRVELPKGTPKTLDEAMGFDQPDHDLMNRSSAGPSTGAMQGVKFGTGSGRERQHAHLRDFYRIIDRGVNEVLRAEGAPLILAGVEEDVAIYRTANTYANVLDQGIPGSLGAAASHPEILRQAHDLARFDLERRAALAMAEAKERLAPARFSTDLNAILRAAVTGRISSLYLDENVERIGIFDGKAFGGTTNWHDEDLLNVAAIETLTRGGAVYSVPSHQMAGAVIAASLRY